MSFQTELQSHIDKVMNKYIDAISTKYNLNSLELKSLWDSSRTDKQKSETKVVETKVTKSEIIDTELSVEKISKSTVPELKAFCRLNNLKTSGKKDELVSRLLNKLNGKTENETLPSVPKTVSNMNVKEQKKNMVTEVAKQAVSRNVENIVIKKNRFDNFEHIPTKMIFNPSTQSVIGTQNVNGKVDPLTDSDIEICKQYNFKFEIPSNLDTKENVNNIKVDELDEVDVENIEQDIEEEIEEDIEEDEEEIIEEED